MPALLAELRAGPDCRGGTSSISLCTSSFAPPSVSAGNGGSTRLPALRNVHIGTIQCSDGRTPEQPQRAIQVGAQYLDSPRDPCFAGCCEAVSIGAPAEHRASAEADRLGDVGAAADPAIHQDLDLPIYRRDHLRQGPQRGRHAVQLPATVIGDGDRSRAFIDGTTGIVTGQHAFDDDRATPAVPDPAQIRPRNRGARQGGVDIEKWHRPVAGNDDVRERPETPVEQEAHEPCWAVEYLRKEGDLRQQIAADKLLHSVPVVALPDPGDRCVDGND